MEANKKFILEKADSAIAQRQGWVDNRIGQIIAIRNLKRAVERAPDAHTLDMLYKELFRLVQK